MSLTPLTETQSEIQKLARDFARTEIVPHADEWDRDAHFPVSVAHRMGELGFLGMVLPEEFDGLGLDTLSYLLALEEIAAADASTAVLMSVHNSTDTRAYSVEAVVTFEFCAAGGAGIVAEGMNGAGHPLLP